LQFAIKEMKLWRYGTTLCDIKKYFHCACAETAIYELPVQNLAIPVAAATSISYNMIIFPLSDDVCGIYFDFFVHNFP